MENSQNDCCCPWTKKPFKYFKLQNRAIRVITKSSYDTSPRFLLDWLGWDNLSVRRAKQKTNLMYKCINNLAPAYLCNLFFPSTPNYDFRNAKKMKKEKSK